MKNILSGIDKHKALFVYYLGFVALSLFLMRPNVELSTTVRSAIFVFVFLPALVNTEFFPFAFLVFNGISHSSFAPILPTTSIFASFVVILAYLMYKGKSLYCLHALFIYFYYLVLSLIHFDESQGFLVWIPLAILVSDMVRTRRDLGLLFNAFLVISLFLSLLYILNRSAFVMQYGAPSEGLERSFWVNPNEFGAVIAAGAVLSVAYILNILSIERNIFSSIVSIITLSLSFFVLALNASRGAFFALTITSVIMLLLSKSKAYIKLLTIVVSAIIVIWMLNNGIFDLMSERMFDDTFDTGGDRTRIWDVKLSLFFSQSHFFELIFGIGRGACNTLGETISTHNDYLTSFIGFGVVGLLLFVFIMWYPIKCAGQRNRTSLLLLSLYLLIESFVAEPFFRGNLVVIMFFFFMVRYSQIEKGA